VYNISIASTDVHKRMEGDLLFAIVRYLSVLVWVEKVREAPKVCLKWSKISLEFHIGKILGLNAHIMLCR